jgi:hypothetical protein
MSLWIDRIRHKSGKDLKGLNRCDCLFCEHKAVIIATTLLGDLVMETNN